jgi:flavin-dependent dehydrogenase
VSGGCESILARALAEHPHAASRLARRVTDPEARVLACRIPPLVAHEATFLVGDAGGGIDPILGCGVTLALESGILAAVAAQAIVRGDTSGEPERNYAKEYRRRTRMRRALAAFLLTLSKHPRLARGTFGLARLFPESFGALVNVAAGDGRNRLPARTKRHASDRDSHSGIEPYRAASTIKST